MNQEIKQTENLESVLNELPEIQTNDLDNPILKISNLDINKNSDNGIFNIELTNYEQKITNFYKQQNVILTYPHSKETVWDDSKDTLVLPSDFVKNLNAKFESIHGVDFREVKKDEDWFNLVMRSTETQTAKDAFVETLEDENSLFKQYIEHDKVRIGGNALKQKAVTNEILSGNDALAQLMNYAGLGTPFNTPLWNTGIWLTFKTPNEASLVSLYQTIMNDRINLGRLTHALVLSNLSVYTTERIINFAIEHIKSTTFQVPEGNLNLLKDIIAVQDIPTIIWGLLRMLYPHGFQYLRPCTSNLDKCRNVEKALLNVEKLQHVNNKALTTWQISHMYNLTPNSKDGDSIKRYKDELLCSKGKKFTFNEENNKPIMLTVKSPSITEYIEAGHKWINTIIKMTDEITDLEQDSEERDILITRYGQASYMRQYSHWVDKIEFGNEEEGVNVIEDRDSVDRCLSSLNGDNLFREKFMSSIMSYINSSSVSVIGINVYECPKCKKVQSSNSKAKEFTNIIPLDLLNVFFLLVTRWIVRIQNRN